jgi:hypothetical protein
MIKFSIFYLYINIDIKIEIDIKNYILVIFLIKLSKCLNFNLNLVPQNFYMKL